MIERCRIKGSAPLFLDDRCRALSLPRSRLRIFPDNVKRVCRARRAFSSIYDACRNRFNNYEVSSRRAFSAVIFTSAGFLRALFFPFCVQECDWHAENNMRERSLAINAFTAEEVGEFYKDNVSGFTMR